MDIVYPSYSDIYTRTPSKTHPSNSDLPLVFKPIFVASRALQEGSAGTTDIENQRLAFTDEGFGARGFFS